MSIDSETKKICKEAVESIDAVNTLSLEDHQKNFIALLYKSITQINQYLQVHGALDDNDVGNLTILRTSLSYINNLINFGFNDKQEIVGIVRPDLVGVIDKLTQELVCMFGEDKDWISLTLAGENMLSAERVIAHYYNPPRRSHTNSIISQVFERLMLMVRGVKG